jgi:uncharacterized membrane protein YgdD (TMEM256/DUF423 family)
LAIGVMQFFIMRKFVVIAAIAGATGVAAGAFGAHALKHVLTESNSTSTWNTAVLYHLIHSVALLSVALRLNTNPLPAACLSKAMVCWAIGIVLFSGSLYGLALGGPSLLGPITPLGGVFFILGWVFIGIGGLKSGATSGNDS